MSSEEGSRCGRNNSPPNAVTQTAYMRPVRSKHTATKQSTSTTLCASRTSSSSPLLLSTMHTKHGLYQTF